MKRFIVALAGSAVLGMSVTAVASAAPAAPTVVTGPTTGVTTTTAVLHGRVNPRGATTDYTFNYGPTASYGAATVARSAGAGIRPVPVAEQLVGLSPGTIYHYEITGVSALGQVVGADGTFTTAGSPPSAVATGPPVSVRKEGATATGTINPNGSATTWAIQYGTTTGYGLQTFVQPAIAAGFAPVPVSVVLGGLAPARLFHYRLVAYHGAIATYGLDATFFTEPINRPSASLSTKTSPSSDTRSPYTFTTTGSLNGGRYIPAAQRCSGTVGIRYYNGKRQLAYVLADVGSDCRYSGRVSFKQTHTTGSVALRVTVSYHGNGYLTSQNKTDHVNAGRAKK